MIHHVGILSLNLCKFKRNVISVAAKDVGKSVSLCTTVGNMENLTFFGIQERNWKYLLKYVDTLALYLELPSEELKIPSHREAYPCLVARDKTLKQSDNILVEVKVSVTQSCPNSLPSDGLQFTRLLCPGIFQARILEWVAVPSSRGSSQPPDQTYVSCFAGRFFTTEPLGKPLDKKTTD